MFTNYEMNLFHEGKDYSCYKFMGAHLKVEDKRQGARFTVWAPNAKKVYVVGNFSNWEAQEDNSLVKETEHGIWSLFIQGIKKGEIYKFAIETEDGKILLKADPYARLSELRPDTASIVTTANNYKWQDKKWTNRRLQDYHKSAINIYEIHLGSWKMNGEEFLSYREIAEVLPSYLLEMNYTHVEFMPLMEHPFDKSWGYQTTGFYAPTSRYGSPDDLRYLIDRLHEQNIGVILDWVPGHFCRDDFGLASFDGQAVYEYAEGWKANNSGWGTLNFDLGRPEVKSFLIANAMYYLKEFHFDGFRVDAVSNMLYLSYGREKGEWTPNSDGTDVNKYAVEFIRELNLNVKLKHPKAIMIAEESTIWENVSKNFEDDGLGFDFKWNMGWMNDSLKYIETDPIYRKHEHNKLTFGMMYNHNENFILPLSHDEVVHGKKSMLDKMWGDYWNKFAGLRAYSTYMIGHPGKKLTFMGMEFGQFIEWSEDKQLDWNLPEEFESHRKLQEYFKTINGIYKNNKSLWKYDYDAKGFEWIDADNNDESIYIFMRSAEHPKKDTLIFICNFTPNTYKEYKVGVPYNTKYKEIMNSDSEMFGGSNKLNTGIIEAKDKASHNQKYSIDITIPPMGAVILAIK